MALESAIALLVPPRPASGKSELRLRALPFCESSFFIHGFLDLPEDEWETAGLAHPSYVGSFSMYGRGLGSPQTKDEPSFPFVFSFGPGHLRVGFEESTLVLIFRDLAGEMIAPPDGWEPGPPVWEDE